MLSRSHFPLAYGKARRPLKFQRSNGWFKKSAESAKLEPSLKLTWPLKMDGWNTTFLLGRPIFRGHVNFREGMPQNDWDIFPRNPQHDPLNGSRKKPEYLIA